MKKLFVFIGIVVALSLSAQTKLTKGGSFKGLDKQRDTLVASDTVDYTIELGNEVYGVMNLAIKSDSVSGVAAYNSYLHKSLSGEADDWGTPIDTVNHSGGGNTYLEFDPVNATSTHYLIRTISTSATQKSNLKVWGRLNEGFVIQQ